ncbi:unnamed protein product, partial [marine sediment metagenome]
IPKISTDHSQEAFRLKLLNEWDDLQLFTLSILKKFLK